MDASVSPRRVLGGEAHDQLAQLDDGWWRTWATRGRLGPVPGDPLAVPAQQRLGRDDPAVAESAGERRGDRCEQGAVVVAEGRPADLTAQDLNLVAQHDDLEVLRAT